MATRVGQWSKTILLGCSLLACGAESGAAADDAEVEGGAAQSPVSVSPVEGTEGERPGEPPAGAPSTEDPAAQDSQGPLVQPPAERTRCSAPPGVSGSPRDVAQLVGLLNSLPKPTSVACFLESLDRPLEVYLTSSDLSLQPADGARNPRTFIVRDELVLSVVPGGESSSLLEFGHVTAPGRSVKGEIAFPLVEDVTAASIVDRIRVGDVSVCGGCHGAETRPSDSFFADGAFESAVAVPLYVYEVGLESLRQEHGACDATLEASRCEMLRAIFDGGEVRRTRLWER